MIQTLKKVSFIKHDAKEAVKEEIKKNTEFMSVSLSEEALRSSMSILSDESDEDDDTLSRWCTFEDFLAYCKPELTMA